MKQRRIDWISAGIVFIIALVIYLITVSPTVAFWDVGEFIACSVNLGVPHPPGTPLYVLIGRIFALLPISPEAAFRINFISVLSAALSTGLIVLLISRVVRTWKIFKTEIKESWVPIAAGVIGAGFTMVGFSIWENALEAEVYAPSALLGLVIVYLALMWRDRVQHQQFLKAPGEEKGLLADNRLMLLALYIIFLSAGIHLTPVMMLFAIIPFIIMVNHRVLPTFFLGILGLSFMLFKPGWPQLAVLSLFVIYFFAEAANTKKGTMPAILFLGAYILLILLAAIKVPPTFMIIGIIALAGAFFFAGVKYKMDMKFFMIGALLLVIAASVQFYLMVRAHHHPSINMVNPSTWDRFLSVLRREQYGMPTVESQIWPRKTVIHPDTGQPTGVSVITGIFWQVALYVKYFLWQWGLQGLAGKPLGVFIFRVLLSSIPIIFGVLGFVSLATRDKKLFWFLLTTYLISSIGLLVYLNMRFGHTGPLPKGLVNLPQEVRERDYFFVFSYVFWGLISGFGVFELLAGVKKAFKKIKGYRLFGAASNTVLVGVIAGVFLVNIPMLNRKGDWIPLEYGYNLLASCDEPSVIFTNGDNDTFPLWFVQEVPSTRYEDNQKPYKAGVINANLSLLNTPWYIEHLKRKGAPISFAYESVDEDVTMVRTVDPSSGATVWSGYVAHPPIDRKTFQMSVGGKSYTENRRGQLIDASGQQAGKVEHETGLVILNQPLSFDTATVVASYGSGEIDNLPSHVFISKTKVIMLADIMIRDMVATNAGRVYRDDQKVSVSGFSTKIPLEYLLPPEIFADSVLTNYQETIMPVYFSSTVSPSKVQDYGPGLIQEGLAYRFRKIPDNEVYVGRPSMDVDVTYRMFTKDFQMTSVLDPKVRKDDNTRGLFINYGIALQELAEHLVARGQTRKAYDLVKIVADFDVDPEIQRIFLSYLYVLAMEAEATEDAQHYKERLYDMGFNEATMQRLQVDYYLRKGVALVREGDTEQAEITLKRVYPYASPDYPDPFRTLFMLYMETGQNQKARTLLEEWEARYPGDPLSFHLYMNYLDDPRAGLRVLDQVIQANPGEPGLIQLRDSIKQANNL